jgi:hypothetical protein
MTVSQSIVQHDLLANFMFEAASRALTGKLVIARDHVVTGFLRMRFEDIPADILLYLLDCLGLDDVLHLLSVRDHLRSHAHRPDEPDRAEILDLLQPTKTVRQPIALASNSATHPIR